MKQCECCGELFVQNEPVLQANSDNLTQAVCEFVGNVFYSLVCDAPDCQAYAQHQCDDFDQYRKGE